MPIFNKPSFDWNHIRSFNNLIYFNRDGKFIMEKIIMIGKEKIELDDVEVKMLSDERFCRVLNAIGRIGHERHLVSKR